jgi:hypothetical protein
MDKKSRRYCFTIPNYSLEDLERFHTLAESLEKHCYISYGLEVAESGLSHIQGYVELNSAQRYAYLQKYFNFRKDGELLKFHVEIANGTAEENRKYTQKEGNGFEFGVPVKQGSRTDLSEIKEAVKTSPKDLPKIIDELAQNNQQLKYAENLQRYYFSHRSTDNPPKVFWLYGQTGIGKTSLVFKTFTDICSVSDYNWIGTGYQQNECLLFDDIRNHNIPFEQLLKITDRYPYTLFYKGGAVPLNSPYIIFTSPCGISQTFGYQSQHENLNQLRRRLTEIDLDMVEDVYAIDLRNYPKNG